MAEGHQNLSTDLLPSSTTPHGSASFSLNKRFWPPYLIAIFGLSVAMVIRRLLGTDQPLLIVFLIPVILSAYVGGLFPGLFATLLALVIADLFIISPSGISHIGLTNLLRLLSFALAGGLFSIASEALHRSSRKAEAQQNTLARILTSRKASDDALRQSEAQMRSVIETLTEGLILSDLEGHLLHWNLAALEMHGYQDAVQARRQVNEFKDIFEISTLTGTKLSFDEWPMPRILRGEPLNGMEVQIRRFDQSWNRIYRYDGGPVLDASGKPILIMLTAIDITVEKQAESALRNAKDVAEAASRAKDEFLAVLSHELRTPLTPVLLLASALERDPRLPPELLEEVSVIRSNTQAEARLIDDLLDLTRITHGKLILRNTDMDVHKQIERAITVCREEINERRQTLIVDLKASHCRIYGDPQRFQQVVWNIVQNASKYTPHGGAITLRTRNCTQGFASSADPAASRYVAARLPETGDSPELVVIEVVDNGIGMQAASMPLIFDPFEQPHRTLENGVGGIGLGLTITKAIVEAHQAGLVVQSAGIGHGSTFSIVFAVHRAATPAKIAEPGIKQEAIAAAIPRQVSNKKILLVEDHATTAQSLQRLIESEAFDVVLADNIASAKLRLETDHFDILLTDLGLPDGDGRELMAFIRQHGKSIFGIVLSGYGMESDLQRTRAAGFAVHLTKPVTADQLFAALERAT